MLVERGKSWTLFNGDCRNMGVLDSGQVDLTLTSPPYFDESTEELLRLPRSQQTQFDVVSEKIARTASGFWHHFSEMFRVCKSGGFLVVQTKDIRYGTYLVPLASAHRQIAESVGFRVCNHIYWRKSCDVRSRTKKFRRDSRSLQLGVDDLEEFLVFLKPGSVSRSGEKLSTDRATQIGEPVWSLPPLGRMRRHPFQSPLEPMLRFVEALSNSGDLVLDPFAGHATTLVAAVRLGRQAIGYEICEDRFRDGVVRLKREDAA